MGLSVSLDVSHSKSFIQEIRAVMRLTLLPRSTFRESRFHYLILLDRSYSMKGEKLEMAKKGVELLVESLPNDSKVTLISFNENVEVHNEFSEPSGVDLDELHKIKVGSGTALYKALETAFRLSKDHQLPSYVILLTDGIPSDMGCMQGIRMKFNLEKCLQVYQSLEVPENVEIISFGIGEDYSEEILKALSDRGRGYFYHVKDPSEIPERMPKLAKSQVSAKNLVVDSVSETAIRLLNYEGFPIRINALEGTTRIYGEFIIPKQYTGKLFTIKVSYEDESGERSNVVELLVESASDQGDFLRSINRDILMEYEYLKTMQGYVKSLEAKDLVEATKNLDRLREIAEQTRRTDLIQTTEELTRSMRSQDTKEALSEATRKLKYQE